MPISVYVIFHILYFGQFNNNLNLQFYRFVVEIKVLDCPLVGFGYTYEKARENAAQFMIEKFQDILIQKLCVTHKHIVSNSV